MAKRTDIQDGITLMLISRIKSTFNGMEDDKFMTLKKYLLDQNIDQIEDDEEFCRAEYEAIRDYCNEHMVTEEDTQEIESRGYDKYQFMEE